MQDHHLYGLTLEWMLADDAGNLQPVGLGRVVFIAESPSSAFDYALDFLAYDNRRHADEPEATDCTPEAFRLVAWVRLCPVCDLAMNECGGRFLRSRAAGGERPDGVADWSDIFESSEMLELPHDG
ncbi:MAG: hypothetical protein AAFP90_16775 [Planctomycetota bacterium]